MRIGIARNYERERIDIVFERAVVKVVRDSDDFDVAFQNVPGFDTDTPVRSRIHYHGREVGSQRVVRGEVTSLFDSDLHERQKVGLDRKHVEPNVLFPVLSGPSRTDPVANERVGGESRIGDGRIAFELVLDGFSLVGHALRYIHRKNVLALVTHIVALHEASLGVGRKSDDDDRNRNDVLERDQNRSQPATLRREPERTLQHECRRERGRIESRRNAGQQAGDHRCDGRDRQDRSVRSDRPVGIDQQRERRAVE